MSRSAILERLIGEHKCDPIARVPEVGHDREFWLGKLRIPLSVPFERETHCLHFRSPGRDTVFFLNISDVGWMAVFAEILNGMPVNQEWVRLEHKRYMKESHNE